jgi:RIO-like serine/threonine protein kinase
MNRGSTLRKRVFTLRKRVFAVSVIREGDWVIKRQPKVMAQTEFWCLSALADRGYARYTAAPAGYDGHETIRMVYVTHHPVTDPAVFLSHYERVMQALHDAQVRHGDLSKCSVIPHDNIPVLIDFAESRSYYDPMPDKRPEGDRIWLARTMVEYCRKTCEQGAWPRLCSRLLESNAGTSATLARALVGSLSSSTD